MSTTITTTNVVIMTENDNNAMRFFDGVDDVDKNSDSELVLMLEDLNGDVNNNNNNNNSTDYFCFKQEKKLIYTVAIIFGCIGLFYLNQQGLVYFMGSSLVWVKSIGAWGYFIFMLLFLAVSFPVILGGYIPLTLGAGAIYGVVWGTVTVSISSTCGACVAFWMSRVFMRRWVETRIASSKEFRFFFKLLQSREHKLVAVLARLSPVPFGLQNSFFAVTDISFRDYFFSTLIGLLPFQILWTHMGTTLRSLSKIGTEEIEFDIYQKVSMAFQIVVAIALLGYFYYMSKKLEAESIKENSNDIKLNINNASMNV